MFERDAIRYIRRHPNGFAPLLLDLGSDGIDVVGPASGNDHVGARLRQAEAHSPTDATGPSEDDGGATDEAEKRISHGRLMPRPSVGSVSLRRHSSKGGMRCKHIRRFRPKINR